MAETLSKFMKYTRHVDHAQWHLDHLDEDWPCNYCELSPDATSLVDALIDKATGQPVEWIDIGQENSDEGA